MCQRCPCMTCWRKGCVIPPQCHSNSKRHARMAPCSVPAGTIQLQNSCVASGGFHGRHRLVPGMVFPVLSDDPASLVPEGHGGWEVYVEGISTCLAKFVRMLVLLNDFCKLCLTHQFTFTQPRYTLADTMVPTGGATTSSVRRRVTRAWALR